MTNPSHVPVLLDRVVALVAPALDRTDRSAVLVDATLGLGGHTEAVLERCPRARVIGVDRDLHALDRAGERLAAYGERVTFVHAVYDEIPEVLDGARPRRPSTACCSTSASPRCSSTCASAASPTPRTPRSTCGWTTPTGPTAADVLNDYPVAELARVLRALRRGEVRPPDRARPSSASARRSRSPRSARLVELLHDAIPAPARRTGGHPAKRTFQALRIEVNDELGGAAPGAARARSTRSGSAAGWWSMSYHSLEDRLVKQAFAAAHPQRRAARPAVRARGPRAGAAAGHPRRRRRPTPEEIDRTRAPPRSGCAPSNECTQEQWHDRVGAATSQQGNRR